MGRSDYFTWKYACVLVVVFSTIVKGQVLSSLEPKFVQPGYHVEPTYDVFGPGESTKDTWSVVMFNVVHSSLQPKLETFMDTDITALFNYSLVCNRRDAHFTLTLATTDTNVLIIKDNTPFSISCLNASVKEELSTSSVTISINETSTQSLPKQRVYVKNGDIHVKLTSGIIGDGSLHFFLHEVAAHNGNRSPLGRNNTSDSNLGNTTMRSWVTSPTLTFTVTVIRKLRPIDTIFRIVIYCVQIFVAMGFGAKLDIKVVKENIFRPVAPGIGLACQYILMPLIAFTVAKLVPIDNKAVSLGIFIAGCCPGGGASNMYSFLLKGDLSLSITMTALSTVAALAMLPAWIYSLGTLFLEGQGVSIPFQMVAVSLAILLTPLVFGFFLRQKFPKIADRLQKLLKPVILIMSLVLLVVGIYSNLYIFRLFKPKIVLAACLLPYVGYFVGGMVAFIFRQPWKRIKTIAIETGMQNTSIAYILLINSFPVPLGDIAAVAPVASAVMTPLPLFLVTIIYLIYQKKCKRKEADSDLDTSNTVEDDGANEKLTKV